MFYVYMQPFGYDRPGCRYIYVAKSVLYCTLILIYIETVNE